MIPLGIIAAMAGKAAGPVVIFLYGLLVLCMWIVPPLYANAWYYRHCTNKIAKAKASYDDAHEQFGEISRNGGTSNVILILFVVLIIPFVGILAAIALPAYQDYTTRAHISGAATIGNSAAESVAEYYYKNQAIPDNLTEAGFVASLPNFVKNISVNNKNGVVSITMAITPVVDKNLLLVPSLDENGKIIWKCMSQEIAAKYLPPACRQ